MDRKLKDDQGPGRESEGWRSRLAADLAAHDAEQRQVWGDTDELLRARYTAGMCTEEEKARVEQAMRDFPAVRESIETVRDLMAKEAATPPAAGDDAGQKRPGERAWAGLVQRPQNEPGTSR